MQYCLHEKISRATRFCISCFYQKNAISLLTGHRDRLWCYLICVYHCYTRDWRPWARHIGRCTCVSLSKKNPTIHQVTTMLATSKNVLFPGHNHLLTTSTDDPSLAGAWAIIKVLGHQYRWLVKSVEHALSWSLDSKQLRT